MKNKFLLTVLTVGLAFACDNKAKNESISEDEPSAKKEISAYQQKEVKPTARTEMILVEGGEFVVGAADYKDQFPPIPVTIDDFYLDKHPVTVAQFSDFVAATGYVTEAEKFGNSGFYNMTQGNWTLKPGTYWQYPLGPEEEKAQDNHPVTHISWNDAVTYAQWTGKRLPTEIEWEYAARAGKTDNIYPWGKNNTSNVKHPANVWQGNQFLKQGVDGFIFTSPVGHFDANQWGFSDMAGNVWEWTADTYSPVIGQPIQTNPNSKVIKGGSFMYDEAGDISYSAIYRAQNTVETSLFNMGFRCAKDAN